MSHILVTRNEFLVASRLHYTMIVINLDGAIHAFLVSLSTKDYDMLHDFMLLSLGLL